jgi:uncharacterized protein YndB with AHSA1/START domain
MTETNSSVAAEPAKQELVLTRIFDAPRSLVFKVWTDPKHLREWWGPHGFTNPVCEADARPGGAIRITMHAPEGVDYPMTGAFQEIVEPERLVFLSAALTGKNGEPLMEILNTVTFAEYGDKTKLTLHARVLWAKPEAAQALAGMEQGWSESLERLRDFLLSDLQGALTNREIIVRRMLDAPRDLVFEVWTDPKHVAQWWGPNGFSTTIKEMDVRPGGIWRLVLHGPDGRDYHNRIVFLEVVKPERLAYKHDPEPGVEFSTHQTTITFTELGGKTLVTMRMLFFSAAERDRIVEKYGALEGAKQTLGKMAEHVAKMLR